MTTELIEILVSCLVASFLGNELAHKTKGIERNSYGRMAVGSATGFFAFLLILLARQVVDLSSPFMFVAPVATSAVYSYFMADAKAFEDIR